MLGGRREGAGRPKGAKNKRTIAVEAAATEVAQRFQVEVPNSFDGDSVAFLQLVYRDPTQPMELRVDCAKAASRFERPALQATLIRDATPTPATRAEADQRIRQLLEKGLSHAAIVTIDARPAEPSAGGVDRAGAC